MLALLRIVEEENKRRKRKKESFFFKLTVSPMFGPFLFYFPAFFSSPKEVFPFLFLFFSQPRHPKNSSCAFT